MRVGQRLKELRESKHLSQGDLEKRTGLFRCYTSRVENGHTVPTIETLEKYAAALEIPMYRLFYEGDEPPEKPNLPGDERGKAMWGTQGGESRELRRFAKAFLRLNEHERRLLLAMAQCMADRSRTQARPVAAGRRSPAWKQMTYASAAIRNRRTERTAARLEAESGPGP